MDDNIENEMYYVWDMSDAKIMTLIFHYGTKINCICFLNVPNYCPHPFLSVLMLWNPRFNIDNTKAHHWTGSLAVMPSVLSFNV
jgi:hypothetical protein